ncbi:hypothetical protein B0H19DRAFT_1228922 [Mycena capillaripes]|nr:hypothetical protein B0H19DRAFT_1228922 [Mycena capillaripes]
MHEVLLLDEVLRQILDLCPTACLPAVARSCRSWKDPALDGIWSHLGSLVPLLNLIPGLTCVDGVYDVECKGTLNLSAFNSYACRIKHITQRHNTRFHPHLLSMLCAPGTPALNSLTSTRLSSTDPHCVPAALSLSPNLRQLDLDFGFKKKGHDTSDAYIESLLRVATRIERVRLRGLADQRLNSGISQMSSLQSLSLRTGAFLTAETLVAISTFPCLSDLELEAGHIDVDGLTEAWSLPASDLSTALVPGEPAAGSWRFQSLEKLHICAQAPLLELLLKTIPPASLHTLRIDATTPSSLSWSSIFDLIRINASQTLHDLTIEHHLDDIDLDTIPATSTGTDTQHTHSSTNDRITFDIIRPLAALRHLRNLTIDMTCIPNLCDQDILALATWWPDLAYLDLGSLHSSECHPSVGSPRATLACLRAFAASMPSLHTLILPLDLSAVPALPPTVRSNTLSRATLTSFAPPPDPATVAHYLHEIFPLLTEVEGTDQHEAEWGQVQTVLRGLQAQQ